MTGNVGEPDTFRRCFPNPMLPEVLRQAGYATALVGSWHVQPGPGLCGIDHFVVPLVNNKYFGQSYYVNSMVPSPTDGWSWDAPFVHTRARYIKTGNASLIWEGHRAGREIGYCHIEKLHNLEQLPSTGFTVSCFPVKIERASAGWTRAVAIIEG